jgi:hypothetical protein
VARNILKEAEHTINSARPEKYGTVEESFGKIAAACNAIFSKAELNGPMTAQKIAKVLVCMKLVRDSYSPDHVDHLLDAAGYIGLLDQLREAETSARLDALAESAIDKAPCACGRTAETGCAKALDYERAETIEDSTSFDEPLSVEGELLAWQNEPTRAPCELFDMEEECAVCAKRWGNHRGLVCPNGSDPRYPYDGSTGLFRPVSP